MRLLVRRVTPCVSNHMLSAEFLGASWDRVKYISGAMNILFMKYNAMDKEASLRANIEPLPRRRVALRQSAAGQGHGQP